MTDYAAFDRLCRTVYLAARAGAVDCTAAFDLAAARLEVSPLDPDATELALLSLECAEATQPRMAEVALGLLATAWAPELPHVFRTGNLRLNHAASCPFRYSSRTSWGVL
jgi:hypothetical protein